MRIYLSSMAHPKRLSKRLAKSAGIPLNRAQHCCAVIFGYNDWHELEQVTAAQLNPPSKPDYLLSSEIVATRRQVIAHRLYSALAQITAPDSDLVWGLMNELDPTGSMPDEVAFVDRRLDDLFPREWRLDLSDPDVAPDFGIEPEDGFVAQVGMSDSRAFESLVRDACRRAPGNSMEWIPSDDYGYRTFAFDFGDRSDFDDIRESAPSVAAIPIRFVPTIQENVLTGVELHIHPVAFATSHLSDEQVYLMVETMIDYLRSARLWACPDWQVCGSVSGVSLRLSGTVSKASVLRIITRFADELTEHAALFSDEMEQGWEDREFLPLRAFDADYDIDVSEEEMLEDLFVQTRRELVDELFKETIAMSRAPAMLAKIMTDRGFGQYAEFTGAMSVDSFADWQKFGAFVCSMERAKAIPTDISLFFRHALVDRLIASEEPPVDSAEFDAYTNLSSEELSARYADAARRLGDEDMARRCEVSDEALWALCAQVRRDLAPLIYEFSQ